MKQRFTFFSALLLTLLCFGGLTVSAQGIVDFTLKNHDGTDVTLSQYKDMQAVVVVFTGNHCVYSKKYEDRLVDLANAYKEKGVQFLLINSNDPVVNQEESLELNAQKATEKEFPFPYLSDADHAVADNFGATKQPEAFVLTVSEGDAPLGGGKEGAAVKITKLYSGRIDDNPLMAEKVKAHFLKDAVEKVLGGDMEPSEGTDPNGCKIRF